MMKVVAGSEPPAGFKIHDYEGALEGGIFSQV